jgi:sugar-specific transcriptional regulator TrmB
MPIDLTPFGFTPTETQVYSALLDRGFTSAYALAKVIGVARANVYQALNGLVSKGAAIQVSDSPQIFRPIGPTELMALISQREAERLKTLELQVAEHGRAGEPTTVTFTGKREFGEIVLRTAARAHSVTCVAQAEVLGLLNLVWRKRLKDNNDTELWSVGGPPRDSPYSVVGSVEPERIAEYFGGAAVLLTADHTVVMGLQPEGDELRGIWSSDVLLAGAVRAAIQAVTTG